MEISTATINPIFSSLTIIGQILIVILIISIFFKKDLALYIIKQLNLWPILIITLTATFGSLIYSDIIGYEPCKLCWLQRIFMYPQIILLGLAIDHRDFQISFYTGWLSAIGAIIAGYHYLVQTGSAPAISCDAVGYSISCSEYFVMQFGYITIPLMALTAFTLTTILSFRFYLSLKK